MRGDGRLAITSWQPRHRPPAAGRGGGGIHLRCVSYYHLILLQCEVDHTSVALEDRSARLTILIDPRKKAVFERLCAEEDATPSQVVRRLIRAYIEERQGRPWRPEEVELPARKRVLRRR